MNYSEVMQYDEIDYNLSSIQESIDILRNAVKNHSLNPDKINELHDNIIKYAIENKQFIASGLVKLIMGD